VLDIAEEIVTINLVMTNPVTASAFFRALGDETRWRIVRLVSDRALCVCELADILGMPPSSVSSHVQIIRKAGLLESETCGKWTYFRIQRDSLDLLRKLARHFPGDSSHATDLANMEKRLAGRESSCCRGPVKLARPRKPAIHLHQS
jgi:ArsR family transcriptional regulator, arsenate/arsenite/antimonite-responsive transcriptional repressor